MIDKNKVIDWAKMGLSMRRLKKMEKTPAFYGTFDKGDALADLTRWDGNFGVLTGKLSGIVCLDIDVHDDEENGINNLKEFLEAHDLTLPKTRTIESPTGGIHMYYKLPESLYDQRFKPNHHAIKSVDFRNHGQFMVLEGSETKDGIYTVKRDVPFDQLPVVPEWVVDLYKTEFNPKDFLSSDEPSYLASKLMLWSKGAESGNRNNWLTQQVGLMFQQNLPFKDVYVWASVINANFIDPPLEASEIKAMLATVSRREQVKKERLKRMESDKDEV